MNIPRRRARPLLAATAALVPLELRAFGQGLGWGLTFPYGLFVRASPAASVEGVRTQFRTPIRELGLLGQYGSGGQIGVMGWAAAAALILGVTLLALAVEFDDEWSPRRLRAAGAAYVAGGALFVLTRIPMYETVFVSASDMPNWFTIPLGALYVAFVGAVFLRWGRDAEMK